MADQVVSSVSVDFNAKDGVTGTINRMRGQFKTLRKDIDGTSAKFKKLGDSAMAVGKQMSMRMTLPIVAAGGASIKMASDFESSMTKIQSLVGRSEQEVKGLTESVLKLSGETARAPQELADAMFFITSAGIEGADAASVLEASAKAAAVGLGEAATIADLATSAMNAYGKENLGASDATDVMVAAVREGKLEASELAGSMGRVLPVASAMGVSFNEVGAAFAALSRTGTNAAEAATQVRGIMTSLLKPTQQAEEALAEMGLSSEGLRKQIADEGLLSTLQTLATEFDGNAAASASVFGNVRALSGVMDLMGKNVAGTEAIFESMNNTLGATDKAFAVTAETTEFKMNQAISDFKVAMIAVGQEIIPVVLPMIQKFAEFVTKVVKAFSDLPGPVKTAVVVFGGLLAVAGPLLIAAGAMVKAFLAIKVAMAGMLGPIGLGIAAVGLLTVAIVKLTGADKEAETRQQALNEQLKAAGDPLQMVQERTAALTEEYERLAGTTQTVDEGIEKLNGSNVLLGELIARDVAPEFENLDIRMHDVNRTVRTGTDEYQRLAGRAKVLRGDNARLADVLEDVDEFTLKVTGSMAKKLRAGELDSEQVAEMLIALDETADAYDDNNEKLDEQAKKFLTNKDNAAKYARMVGVEVFDSLVDTAKLTGEWNHAQDELNRTIANATTDYAIMADGINALARETEVTTDAVAAQAKQVENVRLTWEELRDAAEGRALFFTLALDTAGLYEQLNEAMNAIIDVGSLMPGGDSAALDTQLAISRRISAKLVDTKAADRRTMSSAAKAATAEFENFIKNTTSLGSSVLTDSFAEAIVGSPEQIGKAFDKLFDDAFDTGMTQIPQLRSVFEKAIEQKGGLINLANIRTKLTEDLVTAEDRLAQAIQNQASAQSRVNSLMDQRSQTAQKTASAFGFTFGETPGANASGRAKQLLAQYTAFQLNLTKLRDRGFPVDIISQVIGLGAFEGNQTAQALLAMGDTDFGEFVSSLAGISRIGAAIGNLQAGMMFDSAITGANDQLGAATSGVSAAQLGVTQANLALGENAQSMTLLARVMQEDFAGGIKDFITTLGPLPDNLDRVFELFIAKFNALTEGQSRGIFDVLQNPAMGTVPSMMRQMAKSSTGIAGINSGGGGGAGGGGGPAPGSRSNPIAIVPIAAPSAAMSALIDAGSLDTIQSVRQRDAMRKQGAGFAFADAGSMGLMSGSGRGGTTVDALPGGVVINVQGSVVTEKELLETIRQGALEMQRSGKSWSVDVL